MPKVNSFYLDLRAALAGRFEIALHRGRAVASEPAEAAPLRNPCCKRRGFALIRQNMSLERSLLSAQGYIELEMPDQALAELDALGPRDQLRQETLQMRLFIVMHVKRWEEALSVCARLRALSPEDTTGYIHGAFCLHEMGRTNEAKGLLLDRPFLSAERTNLSLQPRLL